MLTRGGHQWFLTMSVAAWALGAIFVLVLLPALIAYGILGIAVVLATGWLYRRYPVASRIGAAWGILMLVVWNGNLVRYYGWTGAWTAVVLDVIVFLALVVIGYLVTTPNGYDALDGPHREANPDLDWPQRPGPTMKRAAPPLSESERLRQERWS